MEALTRFSRRQILAMSASAGCLAIESTFRGAFAQGAKKIEQYAPELEQVLSTAEPVQELASGTGGALGPTEGPVWWKDGSYLLYSDIHNSRRMKYTPGQGTLVFAEPTNRANGLTRDLQGRLLACEHDSRRVTRQEADGSITVLANSFQGRRLNRPNDVVVKSDGSIYFTDPWSSPLPREQWDLTFSGVYRLSADLGTLTLLLDDMVFPNGLAFSPDEALLYIVDSGLTHGGPAHIRVFEVANGKLRKGRVFAEDFAPGFTDGMRVDMKGNIWCSMGWADPTEDGVRCYAPDGDLIGQVHLPETCANVCFGGKKRNRLFIAASTSIYALYLDIQGAQLP